MEYALNDGHSNEGFDNPMRRAFERLLRRLLTFDKRPALVQLGFSSFES